MTDQNLDVIIKHVTPINPFLSLVANTIDRGSVPGVSAHKIVRYKRELDAAGSGLTKTLVRNHATHNLARMAG